jgi:rhamnulokinase
MRFLAYDLGAESGRAFLGTLEGGRLGLEEVRRFENKIVESSGHSHWDVPHLFGEMKLALRECASRAEGAPSSIGVDTWGADFGLLDANGDLLELPYCYRDPRTEGAMRGVFRRIPRERVYELTGTQVMPFNTLFQLYAQEHRDYQKIEAASDLLFMPDLFNYFFTGEMASEFSSAAASQLFNPRKNDWESELLEAVGVRREIMQEVLTPGTVIGPLRAEFRREVGLQAETPVLAVASHDTASAAAAVPAEGEGWAYISSGTWSLLGVETGEPLITPETMRLNFTNEGGVAGTFMLLKNIAGLWLLERCREDWDRGSGEWTCERLVELGRSAPPFSAFMDPNDERFTNPTSMPVAIALYCLETGQEIPDEPALLVRVVLEGLALKYREILEELRHVYRGPIDRIHIVGGGARNRLLCQYAANATGLPVIAGPYEATAIGNVMVQAESMGQVSGLEESRAIIRNSFELETYEPEDETLWDVAYAQFREIEERCG